METMFKSAFFVCLVYLLLLNTEKKTSPAYKVS